jgi:dynactin 1
VFLIQAADIERDMGEYDIDEVLFNPLQKVLQQTKGAKNISRKLTKRIDDLVEESSALKAHFVPRLNAVNDLMPELTNFAIQVRRATKFIDMYILNSFVVVGAADYATYIRCP